MVAVVKCVSLNPKTNSEFLCVRYNGFKELWSFITITTDRYYGGIVEGDTLSNVMRKVSGEFLIDEASEIRKEFDIWFSGGSVNIMSVLDITSLVVRYIGEHRPELRNKFLHWHEIISKEYGAYDE